MKANTRMRFNFPEIVFFVLICQVVLRFCACGGVAVTCPNLEAPINGSVNVGGVNEGDFASYTCSEGFSLNGTNFRICQANGAWSDLAPSCDIKDCGTPTDPVDGTAVYDTTTFGSVLNYTCNKGHQITAGSLSASCTEDGWDNSPPTCTIDDCLSLTNITDGTVTAPVTTFGATATYTCSTGYYISSGDETRTCQAGGAWNGTEPVCTLHDCKSLSAPSNGTVNVSTTTYNSVATFSCNDGYDINDSAVVTCQANGEWESSPTCDIKDCGNLTAPTDGEVTYTSSVFNSVATFNCNTGYNLTGVTSVTCTNTSSWSDSVPTCIIVDCKPLDKPINGNVNFDPGTTYGKVASYTCENGYELKGSNIRRCEADGQWSSSSPTCEIYDCGTPQSPINGTVNSTLTTFGEEAQYLCNTGYEINGTATTTCGKGTWSGTVPTCEDINECTTGTDNCDTNAICTNTDGSFTCSCNTGYNGDGITCTDIDECMLGTDNCDTNATCTNTPGSFTCSCNTGYNGDGTTCTDIDECTLGTDNCDTNATCTNTDGSFTCACNTGYNGDGTTCTDINECTLGTDNCDTNAACTNTDGSFTCACNTGYNGDGTTCSDINECTLGTDNCDTNATCTNTDGSFTCACNTGYNGDGTTCSDIDECTAGTDTCDTNAACTNTDGSFTCACNSGYIGDGTTCTDFDECTAGTDNCDTNATCTNTPGSFTCSCNTGYNGDGTSCSDINECTAGTDTCDTNAACTNTVGSFTCSCNTGYNGDGSTCTDIDECTLGTDNCDTNAACTNTPGSFTCSCNTGYNGDGTTCTDINECTEGTDNCDTNAACTNTDGSFTCACNAGYNGDGTSCTDIDECTLGTDNCDTNAACTNTPGSFTCACNTGYNGDGTTCTDINECTTGTDNCDTNATCTNTPGSFTCSCNTGYNGDGTTCTDIDECTAGTDNCDTNAACTNTDGSFTCSCNTGYNGDGTTCADIDECALGTDNCDTNATCTNTDGSFTCACNTGYNGDGTTCTDIDECTAGTDTCDTNAACTNTDGSFTCACNTGYNGDGTTCADINECTAGTDNCDTNATCTNTPGSFTCACNTGYNGDGTTCTDINECTTGTDTCDTNAACTNTDGSFTCSCNTGYNGDGTTCTDIDECTAGTDNCDTNATCTNTVGSFTCACNTGYNGDGTTCSDIDECTAGTDNCDTNAACTNTAGSFTCSCNTGYNGDGTSCTDIDECTIGTDNCDTNATCTNTPGSFTCSCNTGYNGDGTTCTDIDECTAGTDNCHINATCTNTAGSFTCTCNKGYSGNGTYCQDCGKLEAPGNGTVNQTGTTYNDEARYICDEGYELTGGDLLRVCQADGSWNGTQGVCTIEDCGNLTSPFGGSVRYNISTYEEIATYSCDTGYQQTGGDMSRTCVAGGKWNGTEIVCQIYSCPNATDPTNGTVTATGNTYGETANFSCDPGFDLDGNKTLTCGSGSWDSSFPICNKKDCGELSTNLSNASVNQTGTKYLDTTVYTCNTGFMIAVGNVSLTVTCQVDGNWSDIVPTCVQTDCGSLTKPDDGQVNTQPGTTYQKLASYTCNQGYNLNGTNVRECQADGYWDGAKPTCQIIDCGNLTNPTNGSVNTSSGTTFFQVASYSCDTGYELSDTLNRTCQLDGNWNGTEPNCSRKDCGSLSTVISNGTASQSGTLYEDTTIYNCDIGYYISQGVVTETVTCMDTGKWNGTVVTCIPVDCKDLAAPSGGQIQYINTFYNTRASYTCNPGHDLNGTNVRTCGADGFWDNSEPACVIKDCGELNDIVNGSVSALVTTFGETAVYKCNLGYYIATGSESRKCNESGQWEGTEPTCGLYDCGSLQGGKFDSVVLSGTTYNSTAVYTCNTGYYVTDGNLTRTCGNGNWSGSPPTCTIRDCGELNDPENGTVSVILTTYLSVADYKCNIGFYNLSGDWQRACGENGTWSGTELQCLIYDCSVPSDTGNGSVSYISTTFGSSATYRCNEGFYTNDSLTVTCGNGTWDGSVPVCTIYDCGALSTVVVNGSVVISGSTYNETAIYTCDDGFLIQQSRSKSITLTCTADGNWDASVPTCEPVDCQGLEAPLNGDVDTSKGTGYLKVAAYTCRKGYRLEGINIRTCQADDNWSDSPPVCMIYDCNSPPGLANGSLSVNVTTYSATVTYTCNTGFYLSSGSEIRTCDHGGSWNGTQPICTLYDCGALTDPKNGTVSVNGQKYNDTGVYRCDKGYYISAGDDIRICGNGSWIGQEPTCSIRDCGELQDPLNGLVYTSNGTTYLQVARYICNDGYYKKSGDSLRTCEAEGAWTGSPVICTIYDCGSLPDIKNGNVTLTGTSYNETATYKCETGYFISSGNETRYCMQGFWSGSQPVCQIYDCGSAGSLENGGVVAMGTQYSDKVTYICNDDYLINGTESNSVQRVCEEGGKWSGQLPTCFLVDCGVLQSPANGTVDLSQGTGLGDMAAYTCNKGFKLSGKNVRECKPSNDWDGEEPTCIIKDCGELDNPANGVVNSTGTAYQEKATYTCNEGFYVSAGNKERLCRSSGFWDGAKPVCTKSIETTPNPNQRDERDMECGYKNEDLLFGIAVSAMTTEDDFVQMKSLVTSAISRSDIDSGDMRIGVFVYSQQIYYVIHLNEHTSRARLIQAVNAVPYHASNESFSQLSVGLAQLPDMFNTSVGDRPDKLNYALMIMDDSVNMTKSIAVADEVREAGIHLDIIAVGFSDTSQLADIVYKPEGHIILIQTYDILKLYVLFVLWKDSSCDCGQITAPVNGYVSTTGSFYLDTATFFCGQGYNMVGYSNLTCQYGGAWNGSPPVCLLEDTTKGPLTTKEPDSGFCGYMNGDMIIAIGVSRTVDEEEFKQTKAVVKSIINHSDIDRGSTRIGLFAFDSTVRDDTLISLTDFKTRSSLLDAVDKFQYRKSESSLQLLSALQQVKTLSADRRNGTLLLTYVILDDDVSYTGSQALADELRDMRILISYMAVGFTNTSTLKSLGVLPMMENVLEIPDFETAEINSQSQFKDESCDCGLPSIPSQGSVTVTGTYFLDVATFSCDEGYDLVGSQQMVCEYGGIWNGSYPTCSPRITVSTTPNPTPTPGIDTTCGMDSLDVIFGIGISETMTKTDFESLKSFVFATIHRSNIDFGITRFGFFLFDKEVITESVIHLNQYRSRADLILAIDSLPYKPSYNLAHLATGLQYLQTMFLAMNGARTGISDMAVIMLDNNVNISNSSDLADELKVRISLQFITVTNENVKQLEEIDNSEGSILNVNSYGVLEWILKNSIYRDEICSCGEIKNPDFGSVVVTGTYFLDVASFSCIDGFELIGSQQLVCQYNHAWSGSPPSCTRTGIVSPPESTMNPKTDCGFTNADVVVGIATSAQTTEEEFGNLISLVKTLITLSDIDSGSTHFGFFMFDAQVNTSNVISLGEMNRTSDLLAAVNRIQFTPFRSKARLELGLNQVLDMYSAKIGRNRADVPDHAFILTGTDVLYYDVFTAANQIRNSGIMLHIIADGYNPVLSSLVYGVDGHYIQLSALDREAFIAQKLFRHPSCDCGELPAPVNGSVSYKQAERREDSTFYLDVALFTCDEGFQLTGPQELVCQNGGNWSSTVPVCISLGVTAITSAKPTTPGQLVTDKECGFQNIDVIFGVGMSSNISEMDFEQIKNLIKKAVDHANIKFGSAQLGFFIYANGLTLKQVALGEYRTQSEIFSAVDRFKYQENNNQVALSTGMNIAKNMFSSPTNNAAAPDYLYMIVDGSVDVKGASDIVGKLKAADIHVDIIAVGMHDSAELHMLTHVEEVERFDTNQMSFKAGLSFNNSNCNCGGIQSPDNGQVLYEDTYFLDVAAFTCDKGYDIVGSRQLICQNRGVWSGSTPLCIPKGSEKAVDVLISLNMTKRPDVDLAKNDTFYKYKDAVKLALEVHYRDILKDDNVTIIINGLSFGSLNVNFTIVISNTAESVQNFTKSTIDLAKGVSVEVLNQSLTVTNMSVGETSVNYVTMTEEELTCNIFIEANGPCDLGYICQLVDDVPNCVPDPKTDCGFPGSVFNGKVLTEDGTLYGKSATFSCDYGYRLVGNDTLICMPSGFWVPKAPTCIYIDCGNVTSPENGMVTLPGGSGYLQLAKFSCNLGYTLVGQRDIMCTENNAWSGKAPTCQINDNYCGAVLDPQHGSVSSTNLSSINSTATFECNTGYKMEGPGTRVCSANTNWEPVQDTKCIIKDCGILRNPLNGSVDQSSGTTFGQTVIFSCSVGYKIFGAELATCMANGNWSSSTPECHITNCGGLSNPPNGLVTASQTTFGQIATYECSLGYEMKGISTRTCQPDGSWSGREPTCLPLDCGPLFNPRNGIVNTSLGTTFGNQATYSCNDGYNLKGLEITECDNTGTWNPDVAPKCELIDCGELMDLQNGSMTLSKGTSYESVATYKCDEGYILKGPTLRECLHTGEWSNRQLQTSCQIIDCGEIFQPMDGSLSLTNKTVFQSVAQFECNNGYKLSGPTSRTCSISGNWEPNQATSCSLQDCGRIQNPVNGNVDHSSGTTYGRVVHFNCSVGYEIFGSKQATCLADGKWSNEAPVCRVTDCKGLPNPDNGTVSASETTFGQVASYNCDEGFTLQGTSSRTCQPDGSWSGSAPTCLVKDCGTLPDPAFGKVEYNSTVYGSEAVYKCDIGYSLQDITRRKCQADRNWSGVTPTCTIIDCGSISSVQFGSYSPPQRNTYNTTVTVSCNTGYQLIGNGTVTCLETSQWSPLPTCKLRDCGELPDPENGLLSIPQGSTYGQTAVFSCKTGYIPSGPTQLECLQDGFWSGTPPTCNVADCGILSDPTNGAVTLSGTKFGDYATYVCDAGHQITDSPTRLCQETAEWSGSKPTCEIRDCGTLKAPAGGNLTLSGTKYGDVATFTCNKGYNIVGLSVLVCRADGFWSAELPVCSLQEGYISKGLTVTLNMTAPPGLTFSNPFTYEAYMKEVKVALQQHYDLRLKDNIIDIIINSMRLGSLIVDYTIVMKDEPEAVKNFSQASLDLAQGSTVEVFNQNLAVDKMTVEDDPVDLLSLQSDELVCTLFLALSGPCQTRYVCTLVDNSPECSFDPGGGNKYHTCNGYRHENLDHPIRISNDCGIPSKPSNGDIDYARGTLYGETVIYTCTSGYTLEGSNTRTCQVDGTWQPPAPACSITDCGGLNNPDNGKVIYGGTVIGQTAFYSCDAGYSLIGATVITCQLDGTWNSPPPTCTITGCGGLPNPLHGTVTVSLNGQSAMYMCQAGYKVNGESIRTCLTSNVWSGTTPTCSAIVCPLLPDPQYGSVTITGTSFEETATYKCTREGYKLSGTNIRICSQDGQWSASAPTCNIVECADLPDLSNGNMVVSGQTYGQTVSYTCNQGYILDGSSMLTCGENGWSDTPPTCKLQGDCGPLQNPTYGYITFTLGTAFLSKATYVCYIGYKLTGNAERECQADNTWSGTSVKCVHVDCGEPPSPGEGKVSYGSGTTYGRVASYSCNSGYDLIGQTSVTCQNNGNWSIIPLCRPKDCGTLSDPLHGMVDTVTGTSFGSTAVYTCNPGFYIIGVGARTCLATGFWDNFEPTCAVRDCGPLATPTNGVVNFPSGTTYGQTATYFCRPGYILSGPASRQCTVDGTWTDSPPVCTAVVCVMPANPGNGQVSLPSGLGVGSVATYTCNPGYVLSPATNAQRTCMINGNWTSSQPACIFVDCGLLSAPMFGDVQISQTSFGHTATYICNQGYIISGSAERTCNSDGTWNGTEPVCTVSDCGTLRNPANGEVKMPDGTLFGATAVYTCNSGYFMKDYYKRTCLSNGTWSRNAPSCQSSRDFALAVGLGVGLTGFVILVLTIVLIIVILYRRNQSRRFLRKPSRVYTLSQPLMAPSLPVKINTSRPLLVPYYSGPTLMDDGASETSERARTWRSRKADYGDPTNPLYYNTSMPRHDYYSFER